MLNVLLVDDDSLVRSGLHNSIDWARYSMTIKEDAESVRKAQSIISGNGNIDIVFTDIVMPEKNGLQLVRWCRENYPMLPVVVLTYHNDFSYIQEALRLGAIDYVIKTELESSGFDDTMKRIQRLALSSRDNKAMLLEGHQINQYRQAIVFWGANASILGLPDNIIFNRYPIDDDTTLIMLESILDNKSYAQIEKKSSKDAIIILFDHVGKMVIHDILYKAKLFMQQEFFYLHLPNLYFYDIDVSSFDIAVSILEPEVYTWIEEQLSSLSWINDNELFKKIMSEIQRIRISPAMVFNLFYALQHKWQHIIKPDSPLMDYYPISEFKYWYEWMDWIKYLRQIISIRGGFAQYKEEIAEAIQKLIIYLNTHFQEDISLSRAAEMAKISVSYFTRCFRNVTGKSFYTYLRDLRIEHACKLLLQTNSSVSRVAELSGFSDQFYFSKLFKKTIGIPPGAYRNRNQKR